MGVGAGYRKIKLHMLTDQRNHFSALAAAIRKYIAASPCLEIWPECRQVLLEHVNQEVEWGLALPVLSCLAVAGSVEQAIPVSAAWYSLRLASELFDNFHDDDSHQKMEKTDPRIAVQFSPGLIFTAFQFISQAYEPLVASRITHLFSEAGFKSNLGYLQLLSKSFHNFPLDDALEAYWQATILKSGSIYRAGMAGGAIAGNGSRKLEGALSEFGTAIAVILQILDDCRDVFSDNAALEYEVSLPILLYSMKLNEAEGKIVYPTAQTRQEVIRQLRTKNIPNMVSSVLEIWQKRARESLKNLEPNEAVQTLASLLDFILSE